MAETHTVAQGEHLAGIASENGFLDYTIVWNDPNNANLKQQRQNPNVLLPGDQVYIPDKTQGPESGGTGQRHVFVVNRDQLKLRLQLEDSYEKPIANAACTLILDDQTQQTTTDGSGKIELQIPPETKRCSLKIGGDQSPFAGDTISVNLGHLDPIDTPTGQLARLNNLGYFPGPSAKPDDPAFVSAVEEFQCDQGLTVDGDMGPVTQAKLKQIHGC
jgi:N-acetylmuramoyl-L-alanine amidase